MKLTLKMEGQCIALIAICLSSRVHGNDVYEGRKYVPYLVNEIELIHERHTYKDFRYETACTAVPMHWTDIPEDKSATLWDAHGITECECVFKIKFPHYKSVMRSICLYKDITWAIPKGSLVEVNGKSLTEKDFVNEMQPVKGFVVAEMNSLAKGYVIGGNFYGTIRLFDKLYGYHLHFYVEPVDNLELYTKQPLIHSRQSGPDHNALVFEYVANDEHEDNLSPDEVAEKIYEKMRNATGGPILTELGKAVDDDLTALDLNKNHTKRATPVHPSIAQKYKEETRKHIASEDITVRFHDDLVGAVDLLGGISSSVIVDTTKTTNLCPLCIWIQPEFAKAFGFKKGQEYGTGEVIEMLERMDWLFRAMDFNVDSLAENFGFRIKSVVVSNQIKVEKKVRRRRRKRRNVNGTRPEPTLSRGKLVFKDVLRQMHGIAEFTNCCAVIAFVYNDITPALSVTTLRGLCSESNLVLVSGKFFQHKVGIYDVQRAVFHGFAHLMGATHDKSLKARCQDRKLAKFYNPFLMHPVQQTNVGLRTNSYGLSFCSKLEVTAFLEANNLNKCLVKDTDVFCGNGMVDLGEECDCGSAWQCHLQECCGESDTIFGCKVNKLGRNIECDKPMHW